MRTDSWNMSFLSHIRLDKEAGAPSLKEQPFESVKRCILEGVLKQGDNLPSSRVMAKNLSIGRVTVISAFRQLIDEGWCAAKTGSSTFVSPRLPSNRASEESFRGRPLSALENPPGAAFRDKKLTSVPMQDFTPFALLAPDHESFPGPKWAQIVGRCSKMPWMHNGYADPGGFPPFRKNIANYLRIARGLRIDHSQVIPTTDNQESLAMAFLSLFQKSDAVAVEDPCYRFHRDLLKFLGLRPVSIPIGPKGLDADDLKRLAPEAKGILIASSHQYPSCAVMSADNRGKLLAWAREKNTFIIDNDFDGELRYGASPIPCIASLESPLSHVITLGTFSRTIYPGLCLGFIVIPEALSTLFENAKLLLSRHCSEVHQVILSEFIERGLYDAHVRHLKKLFSERRRRVLGKVGKALFGLGVFQESDQGRHLTFVFSPSACKDDVGLCRYLRDFYRIETRPLSPCYAERKNEKQGLIFGFTGFGEEAVEIASQKLKKAVHEYLAEERAFHL